MDHAFKRFQNLMLKTLGKSVAMVHSFFILEYLFSKYSVISKFFIDLFAMNNNTFLFFTCCCILELFPKKVFKAAVLAAQMSY